MRKGQGNKGSGEGKYKGQERINQVHEAVERQNTLERPEKITQGKRQNRRTKKAQRKRQKI